jgi:hypothetical protein
LNPGSASNFSLEIYERKDVTGKFNVDVFNMRMVNNSDIHFSHF